MKTALIVLMLAAFSLAGCSGDEGPITDDVADDSNTQVTPDTGNVTVNVTNIAPNATLKASFSPGTLPTPVNFTLNGTDDDGDNMTWTLDIDGDNVGDYNGSLLPASLVHIYEAVGSFNVTLSVMDSSNTTSTSIMVNITEVASAPMMPDPLVYTGSTTAPSVTFQVGEGCWLEYILLPTGDSFNMGENRGGWSYKFAADGHTAIFYDSDNVASTGSGTSGIVPNGSFYVDVCGSGAGAIDHSYTLTVYPPGHPEA